MTGIIRALGNRLRREDGSILPLIAGFAAVALALTLTVAAAGSLYLERKRALSVADGAALAAAESFDLGEIVLAEGAVTPRLQSSSARAAAEDFLARDPDPRNRKLRLADVTVADGRSVTVTIETVWAPPVLTPFLPDGVRIDVSSTARSVFR